MSQFGVENEGSGSMQHSVASSGQGSKPSGTADALPAITLPKGGGAIRGLNEKFAVNSVLGSASASIPLPTSSSRSQFGPQLALSYDSGAGNGQFGFGWQISVPQITRKTDKGLPQYSDDLESDVFILSGAEDLVPVLNHSSEDPWSQRHFRTQDIDGKRYDVLRYRPRIEGLFARVERWTDSSTAEIHWRTITKDNVTSLYGTDNSSRVFDPADADPIHPTRIFTWLICETFDSQGNIVKYHYQAEDSNGIDLAQANEFNRTAQSRSAARYPKRIRYGNTISRLAQPKEKESDWLFELVFDYGDHSAELPMPTQSKTWSSREDPFSTYRSGFEIRMYRLCRRVLMFHHFPHEANVGRDCLISSMDLTYCENSTASFISSITQSSYMRKEIGYMRKALPPLEFEYSKPEVSGEILELDPIAVQNLPTGLDGSTYRWIDLDGEGISGILTQQNDAMFYKRNLGNANFDVAKVLALQPSLLDARQQWVDLSGDGHLDLVQYSAPVSGFYKRSWAYDNGWTPFMSLRSMPNIPWSDKKVKFLDLTGDGHADVLIAEEEVFTWYPGLAEEGFGPAKFWRTPVGDDSGPRLACTDGTESIFTADMTGDGLVDLLRIKNGEVCYWPSLGYGQFGPKIIMDNTPWFDEPDIFQHSRLCLADIDGSGTTDIIYLALSGVKLYFNQSGNRWSEPKVLRSFPRIDDPANVQVVDLLGKGTACLVWSSKWPGDAGRQMRYVDLMGGQKPHLMLSFVNNMGMETRVQYASSTKFYLQDKAAGKPWVTHLPFPVQVVEQVDTIDRISQNRFTKRYSYHHGNYDGYEREFRGFGFIEQWDTENYGALGASSARSTGENLDAASNIPPVLTKSWYHTGAFFEGPQISARFEQEYFREPCDPKRFESDKSQSMLLPDTILPHSIRVGRDGHLPYDLSIDEAREACRSLKGNMLRQEVYNLDSSPKMSIPYRVTEKSYTIELLQPRGTNRHATFFSHPRESVDFQYDRKTYNICGKWEADPRVSHTLVIQVDPFGNALRSASIGYGRQYDDPSDLLTLSDHRTQSTSSITYTDNAFTNEISTVDAYHAPLPAELQSYELLNVNMSRDKPLCSNLLSFEYVRDQIHLACDGKHDLSFEDFGGDGVIGTHPYRRLIKHERTLYRRDDLTARLALGELQSMALPFESYKKILTPSLAKRTYVDNGKLSQVELDKILSKDAGFIHIGEELGWWAPSGEMSFSPSSGDTPEQELAYAREHFFIPRRFRDPFYSTSFNTETFIDYDAYDLLVQEKRDALGNRLTAGERHQDSSLPLVQQGNDYRLLLASLTMDPNRNRTAVAYDVLGHVVGTAVMGKPGESKGDSLAGFNLEMSEEEIQSYFSKPLAKPQDLLQDATSRCLYDVFAYYRTKQDRQPTPLVTATLSRETHSSDGPVTAVQQNIAYSDGFGRVIQMKMRAEAGPIPKCVSIKDEKQDDGTIDNKSLPRWVGTGWKVFNNKGDVVREYEPFFTRSHQFEFAVKVGVSPILIYDPIGRNIAILNPNHSWSKVVFEPWKQMKWDTNDTVLISDPRDDRDVGAYFCRLPEADYLPSWKDQRISGAMGPQEQDAASKASVHANSPDTTLTDNLGRPFLAVTHNRFKSDSQIVDEFYVTRDTLDIDGNKRSTMDAKGRIIARYDFDMLATPIHQASMEAGERWLLQDSMKKARFTWNSRGIQLRTDYDELGRPKSAILKDVSGSETVIGRTLYGESIKNPDLRNCLTKVVKVFDQAGVVISKDYDFKGNSLSNSRQFSSNYKSLVNCSDATDDMLEPKVFTNQTEYDALNRPSRSTQPDGTIMCSSYNEANLLNSLRGYLHGSTEAVDFVSNIDYDAKGQRTHIELGNHVKTNFKYDPLTFRVVEQITRRGRRDPIVQNLHYFYDPVGNITHISDDAQSARYFRNKRADPNSTYTYDAIYRLIEAHGREHLGQNTGSCGSPGPLDPTRNLHDRLDHPNDGKAFGRYYERYFYDEVGNILSTQHKSTDSHVPNWKRRYAYQEASQLQPEKHSNRLSSTIVGSSTESYGYDGSAGLHGNMTSMPHLALMEWNYKDQLQATARTAIKNGGTPEITYYVYDASGSRVRKITERQTEPEREPTRLNERNYLGLLEIYREYTANGNDVSIERETLHVVDDKNNVALVETRTAGTDESPELLIRYQFGNYLKSVVLELDSNAELITYEEYYPYGSSSYQAGSSQVQVPKRYRYSGKEKDESTGLYYHGSRYYAAWLGRWTAPDGIGTADGTDLYAYALGNPIMLHDPNGTDGTTPDPKTDVISLGSWTSPPGGPIYTDLPESLMRQAAKDTGLNAVRLDRGYSDFYDTWKILDPDGIGNKGEKDPRMFTGLQSGIYVQQALDEGQTIHFDVSGVKDIRQAGQTGGEIRSTIMALESGTIETSKAAGGPASNIYIRDGPKLSFIPGGLAEVHGDPLPDRITKELPNFVSRVEQAKAVVNQVEAAAPAAGGFLNNVKSTASSFGGAVRDTIIPEYKQVKDFVTMGGPQVFYPKTTAVVTAVVGAVARSPVTRAVVSTVSAPETALAATAGLAGGVVGNGVANVVRANGGTENQAVGSGVISGGLYGAALGATIGSIVPVIGTGAGALIGGAFGALGGWYGSHYH